ncbi:Sec-independent protein translocase protein TatB, partial [Acidisphaera rubrifaciens]|uniref:Sec-independent protein translocase protein TatB n=1 Tax=Acidisphaera rubrifaciens TaxID=50715 RepID=UPI000A037DA4
MFDFAWSEIAVVTVVALVVIGPKDMPVALKAVTDMIKKARRMAGEFQTHVDEMMREADLGEVREQFNEIRNFNLRSTIERAVDGDGTIRRTLTENPLATPAGTSTPINPMHPTPPTIVPAQRAVIRTIGPAPVPTTVTNPFDFTRAGGAVVEPL